jgi:hypothetical protein
MTMLVTRLIDYKGNLIEIPPCWCLPADVQSKSRAGELGAKVNKKWISK